MNQKDKLISFFRQRCFATKNTYILYFFFWKNKVVDRLKSSRIILVETFAMLWSPATAGPRLVGELGCLVHSSSSANAQSEAASAFGWFDDMYFVKRGQRGASFPLGAIGSERGFLISNSLVLCHSFCSDVYASPGVLLQSSVCTRQ